ncbi:IreB family regulatory phosphoprotein [bacterium 210820-DFI.6.37]|nr:IreB family regulatory phosphoprotein [bacterium 210820-DFI.6.37]
MDRQTRMYDNFDKIEQRTIEEILNIVYDALEERGYNAIDQMVGYILSGDPSYITSHNNARNIIGHIERDDLVEELIKAYLGK